MSELSYGIDTPLELLGKLRLDAERLGELPHQYDLFNFFVTAAVLNEWVVKFYTGNTIALQLEETRKHKNFLLLPNIAGDWLQDRSCLPIDHSDPRRHIYNAISICWETANASKHYHWYATSDVNAISTDPEISDYYQYFFTSTEPDLYIRFGDEHYGLKQLKNIVLQFYTGLLATLDQNR